MLCIFYKRGFPNEFIEENELLMLHTAPKIKFFLFGTLWSLIRKQVGLQCLKSQETGRVTIPQILGNRQGYNPSNQCQSLLCAKNNHIKKSNKGLRRAKHGKTAACRQGKVEQVYIKSKYGHYQSSTCLPVGIEIVPP